MAEEYEESRALNAFDVLCRPICFIRFSSACTRMCLTAQGFAAALEASDSGM